MVTKIFTSKTCPNCPEAKRLGIRLEAEGHNVEMWSIDEYGGLGEAVFYQVNGVPSVLIEDFPEPEILGEWRGVVPAYADVIKILERVE